MRPSRALLFAAPLLAAVACGEESTPAPAPVTPTEPTWGATCGTCALDEQCQTQVTACDSDPECAGYLDCVESCPIAEAGGPETSCVDACPEPSGSSAASAADEVVVCIRSSSVAFNCAEECAAEVMVEGHPCYRQECTPPEPSGNACADCEDTYCCEHWAAYDVSTEARALLMCYQACPVSPPDPSCNQTCDEMHPGGIDIIGERLSCLTFHCPEECADGPLDSCQQCLNTNCEVETGNLQCNGDWWASSNCIEACENDAGCEQDCFDQYPSVADQFGPYSTCLEASCDDVCGT